MYIYLIRTYALLIPNTTEPFILYTVTITPSTTGGSGPPMSTMFYTREEGMFAHTRCTQFFSSIPVSVHNTVPAVTVGNIQGRIDDNGLTVTFTPLTDPNDARGNVSYIVCYMQLGSTDEVCQTTTDSSVTFPGSFAGSLYSVTVTPATTVGAGTQSAPISIGQYTHIYTIYRFISCVYMCQTVYISLGPI